MTGKKKWIPYVIIAVVTIGLLICFFLSAENIKTDYESLDSQVESSLEGYDLAVEVENIDDQRSTLWPVLISLVATLLGSLITTYVFLKEALDRTVDERPYYSAVIQAYRERSMKHLWYYSVGTTLLMAYVVFLYVMFYYFNLRAISILKILLVVFYGICMLCTAWILRECIDINYGIADMAVKMLQKKNLVISQMMDDLENDTCEMFQIMSDSTALIRWLQIEDERDSNNIRINREKFINKFSEWEKLLLILVESESGFLSNKSGVERIRTAILYSEKVYHNDSENSDMEELDAQENGWDYAAYKSIDFWKKRLKIDGKKFCEVYDVLREYRNLLQVQEENEKNKIKNNAYIDCSNNEIAELFYVFLMYLNIRIFRTLPKIEAFLPTGMFQYINFYNTRFENSAFRASLFKDGIFSRSKISNSNFGMARFEICDFYSVDSRDCSLSNTLFRICNFRESIFEYVDFTGACIIDCDFTKTKFKDSILSNLDIFNCVFKQTSFTNSKIWNVNLFNSKYVQIEECDFSECDLHNVKILIDYQERISVDKEKDSLARKYLSFITDENLKEYFWKDNKVDFDIDTLVNIFDVEDDLFYISEVVSNSKGKWKTVSKSIWKVIESTTVLQMKGSIFANSQLSTNGFYRINFEQSIFSKAQMDKIHMIGTYMMGCIMDVANIREGILCAVNMQSTVLDDAIFFHTVCKLVNIEDASLVRLHASQAQMEYCTFCRSDCSGIDLTKARIYNSSFRDAILKSAEMTDAIFEKVCFENSIADNMLSSYSYFQKCILKNAYLEHSCFNYTVFTDCDFSYADFANSAVTNVEFCKCDFKESNFRNTCFINARFIDNYNMKADIFEGCTFISPIFESQDKDSIRRLMTDLEKYIIKV